MGLQDRIIWVFALGLGMAEAGSTLSLTVMLYNEADIPAATWADAKLFAAKSYRAAGIEVSWVECASSLENTQRFRACDQASDRHQPVLKIIPEAIAAGIGTGDSVDALGIAGVSAAFVSYVRVRQKARLWGVSEYVVLGRTMAHELGHLLLGENSHAGRGLMKSRFGKKDLAPESGQFLFEPEQVARLRDFLNRRPD